MCHCSNMNIFWRHLRREGRGLRSCCLMSSRFTGRRKAADKSACFPHHGKGRSGIRAQHRAV